jgi:hypothetical protein
MVATLRRIFVPLAVISLFALSLVPVVTAQGQPKLVVNVTAKVVNDEDSGLCGYWALDHYNKQIQIWQLSSDTFLVKESYEGFWQTFAGAISPGADCTTDTPTEGTTAFGTFQGNLSFTVTGTFSPSKRTDGFIGAFDFGGTQADILLGTYSKQAGIPKFTDMVAFYIPGYTVVSSAPQPFSFVYHYQGQTWIDSSSGISGNIVT